MMNMNADEIVKALRICARTSPCPHDCPRAGVGNDGAECARQLMETAAAKIAELNDFEQSQCAKLLAQLNESQRRERAMEEDLRGAGACFSCKHFRRNGGDCSGAGKCRTDGITIFPCDRPGTYRVEVPDDGRNTYEWRGPQEVDDDPDN